ncbi:MAG: PadR family transcriptional regulator [Spirochaetales bacterium]|nr:PadR family transcriptional regulator [Spirochaetales bacterium]
MSSIDLIIIGFLKRKPMSAYEITRYFEFKRMKKWVKVGSPTIYQNIKKLAAKNYLSSKTIKEGEMPEKVIYSITKSGKKYLLDLMNRFSTNPGKIFFDFNALIANLSLVDKETALEMLQDLKMSFISSKDDVDNDFAEWPDVSTEVKAIMKLYRMIFRDMIKWIDELIENYKDKD